MAQQACSKQNYLPRPVKLCQCGFDLFIRRIVRNALDWHPGKHRTFWWEEETRRVINSKCCGADVFTGRVLCTCRVQNVLSTQNALSQQATSFPGPLTLPLQGAVRWETLGTRLHSRLYTQGSSLYRLGGFIKRFRYLWALNFSQKVHSRSFSGKVMTADNVLFYDWYLLGVKQISSHVHKTES